MIEIAKVFKNDVKCDIYIGKGAGTQINKDFSTTKNDLKIISPFFYDTFTDLILEKLKKSIKVTLVVNDDERLKPFLKKIIKQKNKIDENEKTRFDELKGQLQILKLLKKTFIIFTLISLLISFIFLKNISIFPFKIIILLLEIFFIFLLNYIIKNKENTLENIKITKHTYDYHDYAKNLNLKVLKYNRKCENDNNYANLHSKIFVIDNEIAYLGSLNFTDFGFQYNNETRIKTTDKETIKWINNYISNFFEQNFKSLSFIELANRAYTKN